jgi:FAD/FMN-containing dehydrogenase
MTIPEQATEARQVSAADVGLLAREFRGQLLRRDDPGYDAAREIWNAMYDRHPALIAQCTGVADVVAMVNFARDGGWLPSVRGGGHGAPGYAVCDDDIMIDMSRLKGIRVDPGRRTARVGAGATWGDFDREAQLFGLAVPGGTVSTTGVAGLTLGGGYGWLTRKHGLTLDSLLSVDLVTADGSAITVSKDSDPELFWAIRGGGGNFGVVTSFEFRLHDVGPTVLGGTLAWPFDQARDVLRTYRDYGIQTPENLGLSAYIMHAPAVAPFPAELWDQRALVIVACFNGPIEEGEAVLRPLRAAGRPALDLIGPISYTDQQQILEGTGAAQFGHRSHWKSGYIRNLTDEGIGEFVEQAGRATSKLTIAELSTIDGAPNRVDPEETSCAKRGGRWNHVQITCWDDPGEDEEQVAYARSVAGAMAAHYDGGVYVNFLDVVDQGQIPEAYGEGAWSRLRATKRRVDPANLFRRNQNIPPAAGDGSARPSPTD